MIAAALTTPAITGLVITRDDITLLGRSYKVPRGFGQRTLLVLNLLRNAAGLDELDHIARGLDSLADEQQQFVHNRIYDLDAPWLERQLEIWKHKLDSTRTALQRLTEAARRDDGH
jgi:hypothetical protein